MMETTIFRDYWFSAAHQIEGHPKCGRLHGHNYKVRVGVTGLVSEQTGMVIDFGDLDTIVKPIIDGEMDHRYIVSQDNVEHANPVAELSIMNGWAFNPGLTFSTAECIAEYLAKRIFNNMNVVSISVGVWETHRSMASATYPSLDDED